MSPDWRHVFSCMLTWIGGDSGENWIYLYWCWCSTVLPVSPLEDITKDMSSHRHAVLAEALYKRTTSPSQPSLWLLFFQCILRWRMLYIIGQMSIICRSFKFLTNVVPELFRGILQCLWVWEGWENIFEGLLCFLQISLYWLPFWRCDEEDFKHNPLWVFVDVPLCLQLCEM